jgi:hypothetical protein
MYQSVTSARLLKFYYLATGVFLLLDFLAGINIRVAFLAPWPGWRALYYLFCLGCLGLIVWRPALTLLVSTVESLLTLSALILSMGVRVMGQSVLALEGGGALISAEEVINFVIAGAAAWLGWHRGTQALQKSLRS